MARVDPDDDSIYRWVVRHYRYDPGRKERRHVVVAAFDNAEEFHADIEQRAAQLRAYKEGRDDIDQADYISGVTRQPGYQRLQRNSRLLKRAIEHGVAPAGVVDVDLPSSVGITRAEC
ncbi:MAG TPA: hypothetical protein VMB04_09285 [Mycobacterium sp.]|nr:hypothetical protein [Mycobacterium sp.]